METSGLSLPTHWPTGHLQSPVTYRGEDKSRTLRKTAVLLSPPSPVPSPPLLQASGPVRAQRRSWNIWPPSWQWEWWRGNGAPARPAGHKQGDLSEHHGQHLEPRFSHLSPLLDCYMPLLSGGPASTPHPPRSAPTLQPEGILPGANPITRLLASIGGC